MFGILKIEINKGLELTVRGTRAAFKAMYRLVGLKWQTEMLPEHFKYTAPAKYGYKPRTVATIAKKRRLAKLGKVESGGALDLVWSGLMRRALTTYQQPMSVYPTRVTTHLRGPSYLKTNYKPGRPHLGREVTAVSPQEKREMNIFAQDTLRVTQLAEFKKAKVKKTIKSRS